MENNTRGRCDEIEKGCVHFFAAYIPLLYVLHATFVPRDYMVISPVRISSNPKPRISARQGRNRPNEKKNIHDTDYTLHGIANQRG